MKISLRVAWVSVLLAALSAPAMAAPIVLSVPGPSSSEVFTIQNINLGNSITFEYQFSNVVWVSGTANLNLNAQLLDPFIGGTPQFNAYTGSNTGWLTGTISPTTGLPSPRDLVFDGNNFGITGNSATITIRNVAVDGRIIAAAVPEPGTLGLLGLGLVGLGLTMRRKRAPN